MWTAGRCRCYSLAIHVQLGTASAMFYRGMELQIPHSAGGNKKQIPLSAMFLDLPDLRMDPIKSLDAVIVYRSRRMLR